MTTAGKQPGPAAATTSATAEAWKEENREAIRSANDYVEQHGLPLQRLSDMGMRKGKRSER